MGTSYSCEREAQPSELEAYGDIAGIGVATGFLATCWIVVTVVIIHYCVAFDPKVDPFGRHDAALPGERRWKANPIDEWIFALPTRINGMLEHSSKLIFGFSEHANRHQEPRVVNLRLNSRRHDAFIKTVLNLCDIQLLTGLGILISAFYALASGLSAYHFQVATNLAWFSNLTHLAGLTVLRPYLHQRPYEKWLRWSFMAILAIMLLVAMGPTLFFNWTNYMERTAANATFYAGCFFNPVRSVSWYSLPACYNRTSVESDGTVTVAEVCLLNVKYNYDDSAPSDIKESSAFQSVLVSMILLALSFISRTVKLLSPLSSWAKRVRKRLSNHWKETMRIRSNPTGFLIPINFNGVSLDGGTLISRVSVKLLLSELLLFRLYTDMLTSTLSDVYWLLISAIWGTIRFCASQPFMIPGESDWAFGQILPVFLLVGPLLTAMEQFTPTDRQPSTSYSMDGRNIASQGEVADQGNINVTDEPPTARSHSLQDEVEEYIKTDYYTSFEGKQMNSAVQLVFAQVLIATISMFVELDRPNTSAVRVFVDYAVMVFLIHPSACFLLIVVGVFVGPSRLSRHPLYAILYSLFMLVILGTYSLYPIWTLYSPSSFETPWVEGLGNSDIVILCISCTILIPLVMELLSQAIIEIMQYLRIAAAPAR